MRKFFAALAVLAISLPAMADQDNQRKEDGHKPKLPKIEVHGFIRNYYAFDSREMVALTEDFFTYLPKDRNIGDNGTDLNAYGNFRFAALTSRLWVEVKDYKIEGWKVGARIEADFYNGLGSDKVTGTASLRMRQAFVTMAKSGWTLKAGQAWHPMAADMPDVLSLNTGAPFGPFSRTPLFQTDYRINDKFSLTWAAIWQMQYASNGPAGKSAAYIKYGCTPELYAGVNFKTNGFLMRLGIDMLSIKPRLYNEEKTAKVSDRITTFSPFLYAQYSHKHFSAKFKTIYAQAGDHFNLNGGYGVSSINSDGSWSYTPTRNSSSWLSLKYGTRWQGVLFAGYVRNFGTSKALVDTGHFYFSGNSFANMNRMWRLTPTVLYNLGKLTFGLEYEITGVQYGDTIDLSKGLATDNLHWVTNHRLQGMIKFTF